MRQMSLWGLLCCCFIFTAVPTSTAAPQAKGAVRRVKPPNPDGRKGGASHQAKVKEVEADIKGQTRGGEPVAREKKAMDDIEKATNQRPKFHPYN